MVKNAQKNKSTKKSSVNTKTKNSKAKTTKANKSTKAPKVTKATQKTAPIASNNIKVKKSANKKSEAKKNQDDLANDNSVKGKYIFFKNPKYFAIAKKLVELTPEEIVKDVEKHNFNLQEKIHVGNLLSNLASKKAQQGEFQLGKKIFYGDQKREKFEKAYKDCLSYTKVSLQKLCQLNGMPKSANKETLSERVADGLLNGRIPKCPECFGGRLRFNL